MEIGNKLKRNNLHERTREKILKKAKKEKTTFVDLTNCGLDEYLLDEFFDYYY